MLFRWQGIFRNIKTKNPTIKIIMVGKPGLEALYKDYADEYISVNSVSSNTDGWRVDGEEQRLTNELLKKYPNYLYMPPITCMRIVKEQEFIQYGTRHSGKIRLVCHARNTNKQDTNERNWSIEKWEELLLKLDKEYHRNEIAFIGTKDSAWAPSSDEYSDLRDEDIHNIINLLSGAELTIGPSSGPMHLASLCGCKHIVWTDASIWGSCGGTNRHRYETSWNPLKTESIVIDREGWNPKVNTILKVIENNG